MLQWCSGHTVDQHGQGKVDVLSHVVVFISTKEYVIMNESH